MTVGHALIAVAAVLLLLIPAMSVWYYLRDRKASRPAREMGKYVERDIVNYVVQSSPPPPPVASSRVLTVCWTNIHGWVGLNESLGDVAAVDFLNRFHSAVIPAIRRENGFISSLLGDQCFFAFNAINPDPAHPETAVRTALAIAKLVEEFRTEIPTLKVTIGIATGQGILGNAGSAAYVNYQILGDTVNLASRLCKLSFSSPTTILLSDQTANFVRHLYPLTSHKINWPSKSSELECFELAPPKAVDPTSA